MICSRPSYGLKTTGLRKVTSSANKDSVPAAAAPILGVACLIPLGTGLGVFATTCLLVTSLGLFATNQFHKWAHVEKPGRTLLAGYRAAT